MALLETFVLLILIKVIQTKDHHFWADIHLEYSNIAR